MTSSKEDYLKALYECGGLEKPVQNKVISEKLGIAPASVSEMLSKLGQLGLVKNEAYKGAMLTEAGLAACVDVIRSHRLWEVFLMRCLGYTWREAHEEAQVLEHVTSELMLDRLDAFLGHPGECPHGSQIPRKGQAPDKEGHDLPSLVDLNTGESAVICRVEEDGALLDYLERSGLRINENISVISQDDYEGPVTFRQDDRTISLSFKAARQVYVERSKRPGGSDNGLQNYVET